MLEMTKLSMATVVALFNKPISMHTHHFEHVHAVEQLFLCYEEWNFFSFHHGKIPPEVLKTVCAAEERGEVR
jgi:hypothetical protein